MKLLMITRKVDRSDALAGFTHGWVKKIGSNIDQLFVLCLEKGDASGLPENIKIFSLGKEKNNSRFVRFLNFQFLALKLVPQVDGIFCHMNPEYTMAIAPYAKLFGKKIVAWYTHSKVSFKVKLLEKLADTILTASKESFRLPSGKVIVTGHGINLDIFKPAEAENQIAEKFRIITIGRISPTKDYESLIKAVDILTNNKNIKNIKVDIIGAPGLPEQQVYLDNLVGMVKAMKLEGIIDFTGAISNIETVGHYQNADLFVNLSHTGSVDKAVLEAMACETIILTSNEAFAEIVDPDLMVKQNQPDQLAEKIKEIIDLPEDKKAKIREELRAEVASHHNLDDLAAKIIKQFEK